MEKNSKKTQKEKGGAEMPQKHTVLLSIAIPLLLFPSLFSSAIDSIGSFVTAHSYAEEQVNEDQFADLEKQMEEEGVPYTVVVHESSEVLSTRVVKSYNAVKGQTDKDNCDGAFSPHTGINFCKTKIPIVATNELPLGTIVKIDGKVLLVADRTNKRYKYLYDILTSTYEGAIQWGRQFHEVEIIGKVVKVAS